MPRHLASVIALVAAVGLAVAVNFRGCESSESSAEYRDACVGPRLGTAEKRQQADHDGYDIDSRHDCISKPSFIARNEQRARQKARWEAENTPEAKAARAAENERRWAAEDEERRVATEGVAKTLAERERQWAAAEKAGVTKVEINSAGEAQLANVPGLGAEVARQIHAERAKGAFKGWDDVVGRIAGLGAAQAAMRASAFGLTVNGRSLEGAEPDSQLARAARDGWRRRN